MLTDPIWQFVSSVQNVATRIRTLLKNLLVATLGVEVVDLFWVTVSLIHGVNGV